MSKKSSFRRAFEEQHGRRAQTLLKYASQHLYHLHWSLPSELSWKKSVILRYQILGLLFNTLAADGKCSVLIRKNLTIPIQMQFSQKQNTFSQFLAAFLKYRLIFKHFGKKMTLIAFVFRKLKTRKTLLDKCLKSSFSEDPWTRNMADVAKNCWNLHESIFIIFIYHCQVTRVGKSPHFDMGNLLCAC